MEELPAAGYESTNTLVNKVFHRQAQEDLFGILAARLRRMDIDLE